MHWHWHGHGHWHGHRTLARARAPAYGPQLGVNGAGKTTTLSMLTGDVAPSSGTATLAGFNTATQLPEVS